MIDDISDVVVSGLHNFLIMVVKRDKKNKIIWTGGGTGASGSVAMKYRPPRETPREETKGKLPCAEAASVQQVIIEP